LKPPNYLLLYICTNTPIHPLPYKHPLLTVPHETSPPPYHFQNLLYPGGRRLLPTTTPPRFGQVGDIPRSIVNHKNILRC